MPPRQSGLASRSRAYVGYGSSRSAGSSASNFGGSGDSVAAMAHLHDREGGGRDRTLELEARGGVQAPVLLLVAVWPADEDERVQVEELADVELVPGRQERLEDEQAPGRRQHAGDRAED